MGSKLDIDLWHMRLSHTAYDVVESVLKAVIFHMKYKELLICVFLVCLLKVINCPSKVPFDLIHTDCWDLPRQI